MGMSGVNRLKNARRQKSREKELIASIRKGKDFGGDSGKKKKKSKK